jgi:hypothetical protein
MYLGPSILIKFNPALSPTIGAGKGWMQAAAFGCGLLPPSFLGNMVSQRRGGFIRFIIAHFLLVSDALGCIRKLEIVAFRDRFLFVTPFKSSLRNFISDI